MSVVPQNNFVLFIFAANNKINIKQSPYKIKQTTTVYNKNKQTKQKKCENNANIKLLHLLCIQNNINTQTIKSK